MRGAPQMEKQTKTGWDAQVQGQSPLLEKQPRSLQR